MRSYIGKSKVITLKYKKEVTTIMDEIFNALDPPFCEADEERWCTGTIEVSDDKYFCKQLLLYGNKVEITGPPEVRETMKQMLEESLKVYT